MKQTIRKIVILLIAIVFILILAGNVNAASEPKVETINGNEFFFANGTAITIEERTDSNAGALIKWEGGSINVGPNAYIFGGMHNNDTAVTSSITMNGGTVKHIIGGGLHLSNTTTSTVIINGGTMTSVSGGGVGSGATMGKNCGCDGYTVNSTDGKLADCKVGTANVTINGGTITLVYGGGPSGYTRTDIANIQITSGKADYVTGGGANGYTGTADLDITGGTMTLVQTVNRGTMTNATLNVTGGTITDLFVCAENSADATGEITGKVTAEVSKDAKVQKMQLGMNAGALVDVTTSTVVKKENVRIASGTVVDSSLMMDNVTRLNEVIIDGVYYLVEPGKTIKDLPEYNSIITKEGYEFIELQWAQGKWDENQELFDDLELTTVFEEIGTEDGAATGTVAPEAQPEEKDDTPKTGSLDVVLYISIAIGLVALIGIASIKKYNKK